MSQEKTVSESDPENPKTGESEDGLPSLEEFARWIAEDPANIAEFEQLVERVARGEFAGVSPEMRSAAHAFLAKRHEERCLEVVNQKFRALEEVAKRPAGSMRAKDRLKQTQGLVEEITDALLDTPEPHRTRFLRQLLPIREQIRALRLDDV